MATVDENISIVFKNVRKKQGFVETFKNGAAPIDGTEMTVPLSAEQIQELKNIVIGICDESIVALNEIRTAAGGK
jgi:hypothetical protein